MRHINYHSDFILNEKFRDAQGNKITLPVDGCDIYIVYRTNPWRSFQASVIDGVCTNCRILDDGTLDVLFTDHNLGRGYLQRKASFQFTDAWDGGDAAPVLYLSDTGIELWEYASRGDESMQPTPSAEHEILFSGIVKDQNNNPITGVPVEIYALRFAGERLDIGATISGAAGEYSIRYPMSAEVYAAITSLHWTASDIFGYTGTEVMRDTIPSYEEAVTSGIVEQIPVSKNSGIAITPATITYEPDGITNELTPIGGKTIVTFKGAWSVKSKSGIVKEVSPLSGADASSGVEIDISLYENTGVARSGEVVYEGEDGSTITQTITQKTSAKEVVFYGYVRDQDYVGVGGVRISIYGLSATDAKTPIASITSDSTAGLARGRYIFSWLIDQDYYNENIASLSSIVLEAASKVGYIGAHTILSPVPTYAEAIANAYVNHDISIIHIPPIYITPKSLDFEADGIGKQTTVVFGGTWSVTYKPSWASVEPSSGSNSLVTNTTLDANTDAAARSGQIIYQGEDGSQAVQAISQKGYVAPIAQIPISGTLKIDGSSTALANMQVNIELPDGTVSVYSDANGAWSYIWEITQAEYEAIPSNTQIDLWGTVTDSYSPKVLYHTLPLWSDAINGALENIALTMTQK